MYSKRLRSSVSLILVFILSILSVLEVSAASLKATVVSSEQVQDGKQRISVNSVIDVTYADLKVLEQNNVEFSLFKDEAIVASKVKQKGEIDHISAADSVYSVYFTDISFEGLEAGTEYSLQATYQGETGPVVTPSQTIRVPSSSEIKVVVERITKDSDTYEISPAGEIRSDDKQIRLTILSDGVPLANKGISVSNYNTGYNNFTTDAAGQVQLKGNPKLVFNKSVLFVAVNQGTDQYEAAPLYVTDLQQAGTYTVAIRYLDAKGKLIRQRNNSTSWPSGVVDRVGITGYDVLTLKTGSVSGDFVASIKSENNETYLFQTSQAALYSSTDGSHTTIVQDGQDYSRLSFQYTWNGSPANVESFSIAPNNQYKQINTSSIYQNLDSNAIYVKKDREYDLTAIARVTGMDGKIVFRSKVTPTEPATIVHSAAVASEFSALKLQVPDQGQGSGKVQISYLNDKYNYSLISTSLPAADGTLYVPKGQKIHRLTASAAPDATANSYNNNQVVLESYFSPLENDYTFKAGSTYKAQIILKVRGSSYYEVPETRNRIVLGENVEYRVVMTDEYNNILDLNTNYKAKIVDEAGTTIEENRLSWTTEEKDGKMQRVDKREWKPVKSGTYKIQWFPNYYQNGQYVNGELLAETELQVLPKQELDVEIRGKDGKPVDLVNKPFLTKDQAEKITVTVRQHETGAQGQLLAGVKVQRYGEEIGVTDEQGSLVVPDKYRSYFGELLFKKSDYLSKTVSLAVIDPEKQSVVRVRGLDKPEGETYAGGVPLDFAYVDAVIKKDDGSYNKQSQFISQDDHEAFLVVESPSVVGIDFMRYNRSYLGVESKYGYYMYGSIRTEPGKEYSLVLDARQPLQQVSKVNLTKYMEELSVVRTGLAGADYVPYVIDSNATNENYFYAAQGTYDVLAHTRGNTFIYRDDVVIGEGENTLEIVESDSGLATLLAPESGSIYTVEYTTPSKSKLRGYAYDAAQVQLTPGEVTVQLDQSAGAIEYQYNIHFAPGTLKAGTLTQLAPQAIHGLDIVGLQDGKLVRSAGENSLEVGLVDAAGNSIGQIKKPQILVSNGGWGDWYKYVYPESATYEIQDEAGNELYKGNSLNYPLSVYGYLPDGTYVIKAAITIDGQTYSLDKKFVLESAAGTVVDPGQSTPGEDMDNGQAGQPVNGNNGDVNPGNGNVGTVISSPSPTPAAPSTTINENVDKLQELLKDATGTASERASAAQSALTSIAQSLKSVGTPQEAEQNSKSLTQALNSASQLLEMIQDPVEKQKIVSSVSELMESAPYLLNHLDSPEKAIEFTQALIQNAAAVLNNAQGVAVEALQQLKVGVVSSCQAALNKAGEVTIAKENVTVEGNSVSSSLSEELISNQIQSTKQALTVVSQELTTKLGAGLADELKLSLTVKTPSIGEGINKLNTSLPSEILALVKENGIDGLKLQMDHTAFTIEPDTFGNVEAGQKITLAAEVVQNAVVNKPSQAEPLASIPVMEFSASVGGKAVESFVKPVNVTFDVSSIDTSKYSEANLENLTVYVLDEKSLTWEAVGGKYDPITQTVSAPRGHFSQYTVMLGTGAFSDVLQTHWAVKEINYLLAKGILEQTKEFQPSDKVTRQQFAAWIARAYGLDGKNLSLPFKDVAIGNSYYDEIAAAYAAGIINGKSGKVFDPKATITREEIATMLARALTTYNGVKTITQPGTVNAAFTDGNKISKWAAASVALTKSTQLFEGFEDNTFRPAQTTSKAEAAALIYRLYQLQ
ncbi:S-layer homology domain-containing protein [Paenibacillus sophorae]|uniref:S-layer homology domain-containing protein n=1 Tax=Paenibacillus sophorae TaxID=1333845 RepID=A0A1H8QC39_9BACL|nr:S-layer homology domain-containing protein [Paenibacillus sophorae]QWU15187.1 S-layer homology domain-containing protein [Paenibacillus sophorae]SEO51626.1 S-layer homology domain-containing protein [Paenibacillus sophorae]